MNRNLRIGDILIAHGCLTNEQLISGLQAQKNDPSKRLGEHLMSNGYVTEMQVLNALSARLDIQFVDLNQEPIDYSVVSVVPKALSTRSNMIAYMKKDHTVVIAVNDPLDFYAIEDIKSFFDTQCKLVLCTLDAIRSCIKRAYMQIEAQNAANYVNEYTTTTEQTVDDVEIDGSLSPVVNMVNSMIIKGFAEGASDIHFEPFERFLKVRLRVDGQLLPYTELEIGMAVSISTRIKILAGLDIAERRIPQDGNFKIMLSGNNVSVRVSTVPTAFGEKVVLRFLSRDVAIDHSAQYGMTIDNYKRVSKMLSNPHGIIYITGPTGSGKTTTLYMMLERLAGKNINISTIEDPVERNLASINQVQVNASAGLTFETGLRAMLRQDPDVILIGETRDAETAQISVSAAITGHLVLSTLHTNDAISSVVRLQNMGVASYLVANSLVGVVAQRLVKKVCPHCREVYEATEFDKMVLPGVKMLARGKGCVNCNHSGYKGRVAVHEVFEIDDTIRELIAREVPSQELYAYVKEHEKMSFMKDDIGNYVINGVTSMEEYLKYCSHTI